MASLECRFDPKLSVLVNDIMPDRLFLSPPHMAGEERELVSSVFDSNWIAPIGPMVDRFERELAAVTGVAHVAALSSGTAALHLALRIGGVGVDDEVWCSTMTFIGGVAPVCYVGARLVFFDVNISDYLIDLSLLEEKLEVASQRGGAPKAIITTDLYGNAVSCVEMKRLRDRFGFLWISDTAEGLGSRIEGVHAGTGADFVIHSFNGNKIITTSGGGALASDSEDAINEARFLATQARDPAAHYEHTTYGYNYRLSNVCAAIGVGQLGVLNDRVAARRRIWMAYHDRLSTLPGVQFDTADAASKPNRWLTTMTIDPAAARTTRDEIRHALENANIESRPMWKPMHRQPVFASARLVGSGTNAELLFDNGLCLPSGSAMTDDDVHRVCEIFESAFGAEAII